MSRLTKALRQTRDWFVHLLHLDDSAHRIALGAAVGMFVAMTPTIGFQMLLVLLLLWFIPGNRLAGLPMVWITNPATMVPIYYFNFRLGVLLLGEPKGGYLKEDWSRVVRTVPALSEMLTAPAAWVGEMWRWLGNVWSAMEGILGQLWLGSAIVGLVAGAAAYAVMYFLVRVYRRRIRERLHRLAALHALRARRHAERLARKRRAAEGESSSRR